MSKNKKKFYAVARGQEPGVYTEWSGEKGAQVQVKGFPGARYKSFPTLAEAKQWLEGVRQGREPGNTQPDTAQAGLFTGPRPGAPPAGKKQQPQKPRKKIDAAGALKAGKVVIYTDGGSINNPGPGGYGVVLLSGENRKELSGGFRHTTNNRMELTACIEGLKALNKPCEVLLFSDSKYVVRGIEEGWAERWRQNGWKRSIKAAAENADLWAQLLELLEKHKVEFSWVKGHAGNPENERCDRLATLAARDEKKHARDTAFEKGTTTLVKEKTLFFVLLLFMCCCLTTGAASIDGIPLPAGYIRLNYPGGSFSSWVQSLPLKENKKIARHDGGTVGYDFYDTIAVVKMPLLFKADLEQCADYCMRFWAEYHKAKNLLPNLYLFDYSGNKKFFPASGKSFRNFLKWAFAYSNSYSLKKGCKTIKENELRPGDMIVQNERGGIGHVSMIMDICTTLAGQRLYLMGYSFMPAQEFHIEKAADKYGSGGWFTLEGYCSYLSDFLDLGKPVLRRFNGPLDEWRDFFEAVRDQKISKEKARAIFPALYKQIKTYAGQFPFKPHMRGGAISRSAAGGASGAAGSGSSGGNERGTGAAANPGQSAGEKEPWVFPVQGYAIKDAGKGGFKPDIYYGSSPIKGYNFYDGNKHGGHPAYDIFIRDQDRNCLDDKTKKPVNVLAPVDLLILSTYSTWNEGSDLRGGNYAWALAPNRDMLFYFAHLDDVLARGGDFCKAGTKLGTVGRSGKNAFPARSPTHLHLMVLYINKHKLIPYDYWQHIAGNQ